MTNVVKFEPGEVGEDYRIDPDQVLEAAKGHAFKRLVVIGEMPDGALYVAGSANAGQSVIMMEMAKAQIIYGDD